MQSIISKGKNVEDAIHIGLNLLGVSKKEVDIEIITQETNGFIGIGKKQAVVRLTVTNELSKNIEVQSHSTSLEDLANTVTAMVEKQDVMNETPVNNHVSSTDLVGKSWVKDQRLYVVDSPSHYSTVTIGKGIQLIKNEEVFSGTSTVITEKDLLEIKLEEPQEEPTKWNVSIDNNKLHATIDVEPGYKIIREVQDVEPNEHIELKVRETKVFSNTLQYKEILEKLDALRVSYGFNHSEIMKSVNTLIPGRFEAATGKNAVAGKDGWIELNVDINPMNGLVEDESGKVNFRETKLIPTVEKGTVIATIHPPIPGKPGITVTNEPLPARQTNPLIARTGKGIIEIENKLVAMESGRPSIEIRGKLVKAAIVPKLIHYDNVNLTSGNIHFIGDVEVLGEVEENMLVEAEGDIFIHKSVSAAKLTTAKSIVVKGNVFGSELESGKNNMLIVELGHLVGNMLVELGKMIAVVKQLMKSPAFKSSDFSVTGLQPLLKILMEKRFRNFLISAKKYQDTVEKSKIYLKEGEWIKVSETINQTFITLSNQITTLDRLATLYQDMKELSNQSEVPVEPNSYITISDTVNSSLYCSGDVTIIGKGSINTKIHAGGIVKVHGVVRGGEVYGRMGIEIDEVGSNSGSKTVVAVPHDQLIKLGRVREGTILKIGNVTETIRNERTHIIARLNQDGQINLT
ncbi:hypothetical protein SAMN05216389_10598 [Oceanobacillus limi]|uniref:RNA-binding protein KhpB N-terminal domain-containing protein n=1 Tax=Oceanobacillus limi TaxID=930131 RepID=A0A1I0BPM1_9BACI|nr:FapA family protein [Oceanobacillus limi]SET08228.1 hypothetical protein SAMN05216389_10598 [Oceanobacillus limi]